MEAWRKRKGERGKEAGGRDGGKTFVSSNPHDSRAGFQGMWLESQRVLAPACFQSGDSAKAMKMQTRHGSAFLWLCISSQAARKCSLRGESQPMNLFPWLRGQLGFWVLQGEWNRSSSRRQLHLPSAQLLFTLLTNWEKGEKKGMKRTWKVCFSHVWNGWRSVIHLSRKNCESAAHWATSEEGRPDTSGEGLEATWLEMECRNIPLQTKVLAWVWLESQIFKMVLHLQERWGHCGGVWRFGCWHGDFKLVSLRTPSSSAIVSLRWVGMTLTCVVWGM